MFKLNSNTPDFDVEVKLKLKTFAEKLLERLTDYLALKDELLTRPGSKVMMVL